LFHFMSYDTNGINKRDPRVNGKNHFLPVP
jgi:hypothetical protein